MRAHWFCSSRHFMMTSSNGNIFRVIGPFVRGIHQSPVIPLTKASDAELWCFLWSMPEQTVEQTIDTPVIWEAIASITTSLMLSPKGSQTITSINDDTVRHLVELCNCCISQYSVRYITWSLLIKTRAYWRNGKLVVIPHTLTFRQQKSTWIYKSSAKSISKSEWMTMSTNWNEITFQYLRQSTKAYGFG